jgi:hypothetical protein
MKENNVLKRLGHGFHTAECSTAIAFLKCFITVWVLSSAPVSLLLNGYIMDVPVAKYFFTVLETMDGWGVEALFLFIGLGTVFYFVKDRQRQPAVSILSMIFATATLIGQSYDRTGSWDCIFLFGTQSILAVFIAIGYYFAYKNCILFIGFILEKKKEILYGTAKTRFGRLIFEEHSFLAPLCLIILFGLPWLIFYFPGTLQWDAHHQLWMYVGAAEKTGHFPVLATEYMGMLLSIGRTVFHSDTAGLFLYNIIQFLFQAVTASYVCSLLTRWKTPMLLKAFNLFMWSLYPYFPIYGYTMVKDSMHYIFVLLMTAAVADVISGSAERCVWWKNALILLGAAGITIFRNDGRYLVIITMVFGIILYKRYRKIFIAALAVCIALVVSVDYIYMPLNGIKKGEIGEMLSIPLQQTARYLKEHYDELTDEETEILSEGFKIPLSSVADVYSPLISDGVKSNFVDNPDNEYLKKYFRVWFGQLLKHPDTYIQAFINQTYGYFYPDMRNYGDYLVYLYIGNADKWHDGYLDIEFGIKNDYGRSLLAHYIYLTEKLPIFSMLLSPGMYTYILMGCFAYLLQKNRRKIFLLIPGMCTLLICIASPVNGYLRYVMPLIAVTPLYIAWCYKSGHLETVNGEKYD